MGITSGQPVYQYDTKGRNEIQSVCKWIENNSQSASKTIDAINDKLATSALSNLDPEQAAKMQIADDFESANTESTEEAFIRAGIQTRKKRLKQERQKRKEALSKPFEDN